MSIVYQKKNYSKNQIYQASEKIKVKLSSEGGTVGILTQNPAFYLAAVIGIGRVNRQAFELKLEDGEYFHKCMIEEQNITTIVTDEEEGTKSDLGRPLILFEDSLWGDSLEEIDENKNHISFEIIAEQLDKTQDKILTSSKDVRGWSTFVSNVLKRNMSHTLYVHETCDLWNPYILFIAFKNDCVVEVIETVHEKSAIKQLKEINYSTLCMSLSQFYDMKYDMIVESELKNVIHDVITYGNELYDLHSIKEHFNHVGIRWHNFMGNGSLQMISSIRKEDDGTLHHLAKEMKGVTASIMNRSLKAMPQGVPEALYVQQERPIKTEFVGKRLPDGKIYITGLAKGYCFYRGRLCSVQMLEQQIKEKLSVSKVKAQFHEGKIVIFYAKTKAVSENEIKEFVERKVPAFYPELEWNQETEDMIMQTTFRNLLKRKKACISYEPIEMTPQRREIMEVWKEILNLKEISVDVNFFDIGGNSALFVQMLARVTDITKKEVSMMKLMEHATLRKYYEYLEEDMAEEDISLHDIVEEDIKAETYLTNIKEAKKLNKNVDFSIRNVLLTGASGFLGCFLLKELLEQTDAAIYCLIRERDEKCAYQKLFDAMCYYKLDAFMDSKRIIPLPGDLGKEQFGLSDEIYESLCESVDMIIHSGAVVNFVYHYEMLKNENVVGTGRILQFASTKKIKPVHYISSMAIFGVGKKAGIVDEGYTLDLDDLPRSGYNQTKWAGDVLINNARTIGLPCNVYRVGNVCGDSINGVCQTRDFIWMLFKVGIEMKKFPEYYRLPFAMSTVDSIARSIVQLAIAQADTEGDNFHVMSGTTVIYQQLLDWVKTYGFDFTMNGFQDWVELVQIYTKKLSVKFQSIPSVIGIQEDVADDFEFIQYDNQKTRKRIEELGGKILPLSEEIFHKHLNHFEEINFIQAKK